MIESKSSIAMYFGACDERLSAGRTTRLWWTFEGFACFEHGKCSSFCFFGELSDQIVMGFEGLSPPSPQEVLPAF
jgi:hypothetical protein